MIISDKDAVARLSSPLNLINKMRSLSSGNGNGKQDAMSLFGIGRKEKVEGKKEESSRSFLNPFGNKKIENEIKEDNKIEDNKIENQTNVSTTPILPQAPQQIATPTAENLNSLLNNGDQQIKLSLAHDKALDVLTTSVDMLKSKLDDIKADKLPSVIAATSKVVESIRRERSEAAKNNKGGDVHYHFYTPIQKKIEDYEIIEVSEVSSEVSD